MDPASEQDPVHKALVMAVAMQYEAHEKNKRLQAQLDEAFEKIKLLEAELEQKPQKKLEEGVLPAPWPTAGEAANVEIKEQRAAGEEASMQIEEQHEAGVRRPRIKALRFRMVTSAPEAQPPPLQAQPPPLPLQPPELQAELQAKTQPPPPPPPPAAGATPPGAKRPLSPLDTKAAKKVQRSESPPVAGPPSAADLQANRAKLRPVQRAPGQPQTSSVQDPTQMLGLRLAMTRAAVDGETDAVDGETDGTWSDVD